MRAFLSGWRSPTRTGLPHGEPRLSSPFGLGGPRRSRPACPPASSRPCSGLSHPSCLSRPSFGRALDQERGSLPPHVGANDGPLRSCARRLAVFSRRPSGIGTGAPVTRRVVEGIRLGRQVRQGWEKDTHPRGSRSRRRTESSVSRCCWRLVFHAAVSAGCGDERRSPCARRSRPETFEPRSPPPSFRARAQAVAASAALLMRDDWG
jgi:hypothetical protein